MSTYTSEQELMRLRAEISTIYRAAGFLIDFCKESGGVEALAKWDFARPSGIGAGSGG